LRKTTLTINDEDVEIGYSVYDETRIPENKQIIDINIESCPQSIIDCFGESEIEQMIREELHGKQRVDGVR
jgi:hypothetical protein